MESSFCSLKVLHSNGGGNLSVKIDFMFIFIDYELRLISS